MHFQHTIPSRVLLSVCRRQVFPSPCLLLPEHIQLSQLLTHDVLQPLGCPLLDLLQSVKHLSCTMEAESGYSIPLLSHNCSAEGRNHFSLANTAWDDTGLPCHQGALLAPGQCGVHRDLQASPAKLLSGQSDLSFCAPFTTALH